MQIGIDVGATKIESVVLEEDGMKNTDREQNVLKITYQS